MALSQKEWAMLKEAAEQEAAKRLGKHWADAFAKTDAKVGSTLRIRIPENFTIADEPIVKMEGRITRFDPSTKTRVPVTQEWVDEAVAEIVRLNVELSNNAEPMPGTDMLKTDRIWEAVRAASAV